jgi:hypothetical protein
MVIIDPIQIDIETPHYIRPPRAAPPHPMPTTEYISPPPALPPHPMPITNYMQFDDPDDPVHFSTLHAQLAPSMAQCYALKSRAWFEISISKIDDIQWAKEAFDQLVLKDSMKSMLLGLVQRHKKDKNEVLSDLIPSKGKVRALGDFDQWATANEHSGPDNPSAWTSWCWQNSDRRDNRGIHTKAHCFRLT